jgi:hypothetical protein
MPNVYIDVSFFDSTQANVGIDVDYVAVDADLLGTYNLKTDIEVCDVHNLKDNGYFNSEVSISIVDLSSSYISLDTVFNKPYTSIYLLDTPTSFTSARVNSLSEDSVNNILSYFSGYISSPSGTGLNQEVSAIFGENFATSYNYLSEYWIFSSSSGTINNDVSYMNYTGTLTPSGIPIEYYFSDLNKRLEYSLGSGIDSLMNYPVDIFFAGWVNYTTQLDCIAALLNTNSITIDSELTGTGKKDGYYLDLHSTLLKEAKAPIIDVFSALVDYYEMFFELNTISGSKQCIYNDVFSTNMSTWNYLLDIGLFPIYFDNFSIGRGEYTIVDTICIDAHDPIYGLVASGTYMKIDDTRVSGTLSELSDGFRICIDIQDNLHLFSGITKITAHAENYNNNFLEEDYYLTSGYIVDFNNVSGINGIDYGANKKVYVRMEAEDLASCPTAISDGYYFISRDYSNSDIGVTIYPVGGWHEGTKNLSASVYPDSTAYFYDKEFEVVIKVKDYAGNEIEPYIINFRIYNPDE